MNHSILIDDGKRHGPLWWRKFVGQAARAVYPSYGHCGCCGRPWPICKSHTTQYGAGFISPVTLSINGKGASTIPIHFNNGMFPLCEECWAELTPAERLPFYRQLWNQWEEHGVDETTGEWETIQEAVLAGR